MIKVFSFILFIIILALVIPIRIYAQVILINEIFANPENEDEEFIELYNNSDLEVDLSNWKISDLVKTHVLSDSILPKSYLVLDKTMTGIALNNSSETVTLFDQTDNTIDSFSYDITIEGKSWSRVPDVTGNFENNTDISKGYLNAIPPTPTHTITPTPTNTPKPTKSPTSTDAPTATKVLAATSISKKSTNELKPTTKISTTNYPTQNIKTETKGVSTAASQDTSDKMEIDNGSQNYLYSLSTGFGMLILACGILLYRKFKNRNDEDEF